MDVSSGIMHFLRERPKKKLWLKSSGTVLLAERQRISLTKSGWTSQRGRAQSVEQRSAIARQRAQTCEKLSQVLSPCFEEGRTSS